MKDVRFVVFHTPGPQWLAGKTLFDQPGVMEHVGHYRKLLEAGKLALGGPHLDATGGGMMISAAVLQRQGFRPSPQKIQPSNRASYSSRFGHGLSA